MNQKRDTLIVRSYGRCSGRMSAAQKKILSSESSYFLPYDSDVSISSIFNGHFSKFSLEIGIGMGDFLMRRMMLFPQKCHVGVEVYMQGIARVLSYIDLQKKTDLQVKLIASDIWPVMQNMLSSETCDEIFMLFPDPWPKRRHRRRRLLKPSFCYLIADRLIQGGDFYFSTDYRDYAEEAVSYLNATEAFVNMHESECLGFVTRSYPFWYTKYETKAIERGQAIFDIHFRKKYKNNQ